MAKGQGFAETPRAGPLDAADGRDRRRQPPLIGPLDPVLALALPILAGLAWTVPERLWPAITASLKPFQVLDLSARPKDTARRIEAVLGERDIAIPPRRLLGVLARENLRAQLHLLRSLRPGGGWRPVIGLEGTERIESALDQGRGALLWVGHFVHASLVVKMALCRAGHRLHHLSRPRHGYSSSRLGIRYLNALVRAAEDRHLAERVPLADDNPVAAVRTLRHRLGDNRPVSISARDDSKHPCRVPFLSGHLVLASGAADLAHATGAPLLPVFCVRDQAGFRVIVEAPLTVDRALSRRQSSWRVARDLAAATERHVLDHPGQWLGWPHL
ncbi:MAG: hypothetical protein QF926_13145 [Alphaproteobacteria bacterium]|jgi:lauroyl/myristoyl acyltransferase|nr:hypothetical protein [Alphaproteobacteria bacterium]